MKRKRMKNKIYGTREEARSDNLITSKSFTTVGFNMLQAIRCHRQNTKDNTINGSEESGLSEAIHSDKLRITTLIS